MNESTNLTGKPGDIFMDKGKTFCRINFHFVPLQDLSDSSRISMGAINESTNLTGKPGDIFMDKGKTFCRINCHFVPLQDLSNSSRISMGAIKMSLSTSLASLETFLYMKTFYRMNGLPFSSLARSANS